MTEILFTFTITSTSDAAAARHRIGRWAAQLAPTEQADDFAAAVTAVAQHTLHHAPGVPIEMTLDDGPPLTFVAQIGAADTRTLVRLDARDHEPRDHHAVADAMRAVGASTAGDGPPRSRGPGGAWRGLAPLGHELRTPVNAIRALAELLLDGADGRLNSEQHTQVSLIRTAAEDASALIDDMLDIAAADAGAIRVRPARFDLRDLLQRITDRMRPLVAARVALVVDAAHPCQLHQDAQRVGQILTNLLSNAAKVTSRGEIRVSLEPKPTSGEVAIAVTDTGLGIAPADHTRIFEDFVQLEHAGRKRGPGTGLGLPLARKLAQALGGGLTLTASTPGRGSTFTLTLPIAGVESASGRPARGGRATQISLA